MSTFTEILSSQPDTPFNSTPASAMLASSANAYGLDLAVVTQKADTSLLAADLEVPAIATVPELAESSVLLTALGADGIPSTELLANEAAADPLTGQADLAVVAFDVNDDRIVGGQSRLTFTLTNQGSADAGAFDLALVYADDLPLGDPTDQILQTLSFEGLAAGTFLTQTVEVSLPLGLLYQRAIAEDSPGMESGFVSQHRDAIGLVIDPNNQVAELDEQNNSNQGQGKDSDDITYFPWDVDSSGAVTPVDAIFVVNRLGQDDHQADLDGNGQVTPTEAIAIVNRLGYSSNAAVMNDPNVGPTAVPDRFTTNEDQAIAGNVLLDNGFGVDSDVNGDPLTIISYTEAAHGSVTIDADGTFDYVPNQNYYGSDTFEYIVTDGQEGEATTTVNLMIKPVNDPPITLDDAVVTQEDTSVSGNVLNGSNGGVDSDPDGDSLAITGYSSPANGAVVINADGTFTYTPNSNFYGADSFTYSVSDGQTGSTATVNITVTPVNDKPDAVDDSFVVGDVTSITRNVLANDTDIDSPTLTITGTTDPANGRVVLNSDGTLTYAPNPSFIGVDNFTYTISDGELSDTATVSVTVEAIEIFNNTNIGQVFNSPLAPPSFSTNRPYMVTSLQTYHWNNGQGDIPQGRFFLSDNQGKTYGSWAIQTSSGSGGAPDVDWSSTPSVAIPPGTYSVIDPNPGTWSYNSGSGNAGFARVIGRPVDALISDTEFFGNNWSTQSLRATNGATESIRQGPWPPQGNVRGMVHNQPPAGALNTDLFVFHEFNGMTYTPASSGEILSINYSEDFIHFDPPFPGAAVRWGPAVRQNGVVYVGPTNMFTHFTYTTDTNFTPFKTGQMIDLDQNDFLAYSGSSHPDFSATGGQISFGFLRATTHTGPTVEARDHGIDNWQFALTTN